MRDDLVAIDIHTHPQVPEMQRAVGARIKQMEQYFGRSREAVSFAEMAEMYQEHHMMAVILNSDDETVSGIPPAPNDLLTDAANRYPDTFIPFCAIDPWKGQSAVEELRRCADLGARGVGELNGGRQLFCPSDRRFYPLWETAVELGLVLLFHTGMMGAGARTPGGMGYKLKFTNPLQLDEVAADFPELKIISAHPGWPFQQEQLAMVRHKTNVYMDISGWAPKYLAPEVIHYVNTMISDQVLFGTDWPALTVDRFFTEFDRIELRPGIRHKVLRDNARALLGI
ncbi:MAG: amidohydrolase family protein [Streptosporangiaceae bacterium]